KKHVEPTFMGPTKKLSKDFGGCTLKDLPINREGRREKEWATEEREEKEEEKEEERKRKEREEEEGK
ncbi:HXXXD-type acyl-transferase family protein, partial [Prunus dulcis]